MDQRYEFDFIRDAYKSRLGWLAAPASMAPHVEELERFAAGVRASGIDHVYLLGMGGSSLCAEVLKEMQHTGRHGAHLDVLDTTDEKTIAGISASLQPHRSLFLVSSKSGGTIEVTSLDRHFFALMSRAIGAEASQHFVAITDPDTPLAAHARDQRYRHIFINPPDIGGRYSALSLFGLVPGVLLGWDVRALLESGRAIAARCDQEGPKSPGAALGAFMASSAMAGRDKLTLLAPPALATVGLWIEQLIAESTGKNGRGILPIVGEPAGDAAEYGADRAFVALIMPHDTEVTALADAIEAHGHPVFRIETTATALGGEFFRWEFATATAGVQIGVNPFDEPNVTDAKNRTKAQLEVFLKQGQLRIEPKLERADGILRREHGSSGDEGPFVILDYMPPDARRHAAASAARVRVRRRTRAATTYGVGPRYLHSTGQYHKGGPNRGTFVILTGADRTTTEIPGGSYSFSVLKQAQALGDFEALAAAGRHVIHYHVDDPQADFSAVLEKLR